MQLWVNSLAVRLSCMTWSTCSMRFTTRNGLFMGARLKNHNMGLTAESQVKSNLGVKILQQIRTTASVSSIAVYESVASENKNMVLLEVCIDSLSGARAAAGAQRVELCSNLLEGGITPSHGLIQQVRQVLGSTRLMVLIRPRGGDFVYSSEELEVMLADIAACRQLGAHGVVFGCLLPDGRVDQAATGKLVQAANAHGLEITFHRAFDVSRDLRESLEDIIILGIPRVLTAGGCPTAEQGAATIASLVQQAAGRITILAGGGVRSSNVTSVVAQTGVQEVHSAAKRRHTSTMQFRRADLPLSAQTPPNDFEWNITDGDEVKALVHACSTAATKAT